MNDFNDESFYLIAGEDLNALKRYIELADNSISFDKRDMANRLYLFLSAIKEEGVPHGYREVPHVS